MNALKRFIPLLALMGAIAYLGFHAWTGDQGVRSQMVTLDRIVRAEAELSQVRASRVALEDRVARLSEDGVKAGVDVDYLEERVRDELRFAHPHEIVIDLTRAPAR